MNSLVKRLSCEEKNKYKCLDMGQDLQSGPVSKTYACGDHLTLVRFHKNLPLKVNIMVATSACQ